MLELLVTAREAYDEVNNEFITLDSDVTLQLEHSLVSISKWESKWHIPFLKKGEKTVEQTLDYIRCMVIKPRPVPSEVFQLLTNKEISLVNEYIMDPMTATTFRERSGKGKGRLNPITTSEEFYHYMTVYHIPFECEKWHLNRLITLIKVCQTKDGSSSNKKMSQADILRENARINEERRKAMHTSG